MNIRLVLVAVALVFQILSFMKLSGHDYIGIPFVPGPTEQAPANLDASSPLELGGVDPSEINAVATPTGSFVAVEGPGGARQISIVAGASPMGSGQGGNGAASPQSPQAATPGSPDRPASGTAGAGSNSGGGGNNFGGVVGSPIGNQGGSGSGGADDDDSPADTPGDGDSPGDGSDSGSGDGSSGGGGGGPQGGPGGSGGIPAGNGGGGGGGPIGEPTAGGGGATCLVAVGCESAGDGPGEESVGGGEEGVFLPAKPIEGGEEPAPPAEPVPSDAATL